MLMTSFVSDRVPNEYLKSSDWKLILFLIHKCSLCVFYFADGSGEVVEPVLLSAKPNFTECFDVQADVGKTVKLSWAFDALPAVKPTGVSMSKNNIDFDHSQQPYRHELEDGFFQLELPVESPADYANYTLTLTNEAGTSFCTVMLNLTGNNIVECE